ncbi:unnamed protein product [Meganyctiphanes norvegica]|uniref:Apoptogenic protein 1, mitochondrial n=1 Tax=Meganyctiphanes norvegica TaxID=48144 RepID=A0AAV2PUY8_MEGNR
MQRPINCALFSHTTRISNYALSFSNKRYSSDRKTKKEAIKEAPVGISDPQESGCDCIGPSDPVSNIRAVNYFLPPNETSLQQLYRESRQVTEKENHDFWTDHNVQFKKMKADFIQKRLHEKYMSSEDHEVPRRLTAEEMSEFYKGFLDENRKKHMEYNKQWYRNNFKNVFLAAKVWIQQNLRTKR